MKIINWECSEDKEIQPLDGKGHKSKSFITDIESSFIIDTDFDDIIDKIILNGVVYVREEDD